MSAAADDAVMVNQAVNAAVASGRSISTINQTGGSNNFAKTDQFGSQNSATINQLGNSNQSMIIQNNAVGAMAVDTQIGNGNQITITQTGPNPPPINITQRR
jgi:hypothetical protein